MGTKTKHANKLAKKLTITPAQSAAISLAGIAGKFQKLKDLRAQINKLKVLYQQHDALMEEILPLLIEVQADKFIVHREFTLGNQTYRVSPYFYDEKKSKLTAKVWKSTAFEAVAVE